MAVVSDPAPSSAYSSALHRLAGAQKPSHGVPAYTRDVNRPLGRRLAALSHAANLTPIRSRRSAGCALSSGSSCCSSSNRVR